MFDESKQRCGTGFEGVQALGLVSGSWLEQAGVARVENEFPFVLFFEFRQTKRKV